MPHVIDKLWPGKTDAQKSQLADAIQVWRPDIVAHPERLFRKPGYTM